MKIVDTHQHLWDTDILRYAWLDSLPKINRSFRLGDYQQATTGLDIEKTVFVECDVDEDQIADEALRVLKLADQPRTRIAGVISSARPENDRFEAQIETLVGYDKLKGIRRVFHTQPDELGRGGQFIENVRKLANYNLSFDICVLARQLPVAISLVERCPGVSFILDHCGVPQVKERLLDPWRRHIREISKAPNVSCKISGIVAYTDPLNWIPDDLRPFVEHVLSCFGWDRVMFGSDWPVCTLSATYKDWVGTLVSLTGSAGERNQAKLFRENAMRIYRLK